MLLTILYHINEIRDMINLMSGSNNMKLTKQRKVYEISIGRSFANDLKKESRPPVRIML